MRATIGASAPELLRTFTEIIIAASLKRPFVTALSKIGSTKVKSAGILAIRCGRSVFAAVAKAFGMGGFRTFSARVNSTLPIVEADTQPGLPPNHGGPKKRAGVVNSLLMLGACLQRDCGHLHTELGGCSETVSIAVAVSPREKSVPIFLVVGVPILDLLQYVATVSHKFRGLFEPQIRFLHG